MCWEKISAKSLREKGLLKLEGDELCGIYKWWAAKEELLKILKKLKVVDFIDVDKEIEHKEIENKEMYCIYVGKATDLRDRLKKHMRGSIDNSTLRKSLGAILWNGEKKEDLKNKINNEFIDKFFVEYKCVENVGLLDVEESEEISKCLRILNIDGFNHKTFMQYINQPLSDLRDKLKKIKVKGVHYENK